MRILELFSGYGTSSFALKQLEITYELIGYSDIDKYANQCFKQNHCPEDTEDKLRLGDVRNINPNNLQDFDLLTSGFPCQSFSIAGKMKGELDTRGTLFNEIIRIAEVKKPKYMLLENVKGLTCKKFKDTFSKILSELDRIGYNVYWKVLNTKDFGIPKSRARVWFVCFRKDIDTPLKFQFPQPFPLTIFIKDILETNVDKKYYLSEKLQERFSKYLQDKECQKIIDNGGRETKKDDGTAFTLGASGRNCGNNIAISNKSQYDTDMSIAEIGEANRVYGTEGICPPIKKNEIKIYENHRVDEIREYENVSNNLSQAMGTLFPPVPIILTGLQEHQSIKEDGVSNCLPTAMGGGGGHIPMIAISNSSPRECGFQEVSPTLLSRDYKDPKIVSNTITTAIGRIGSSSEELGYIENNMSCGQLRRLTPKECFRLQGFLNDEVKLDGLSDTQCYKLAGNGQSVNVVKLIFKEMFKE